MNSGTGGDSVAADDIGGVKFQRVKVVIGADNTNDGDVASGNPLPVTLAAGTNTNEVVGDAAHDAAAAGNPLLLGAYAKAAAPTDVDADADAVRLWALRNGALAINVTAAGTLIAGGGGTEATALRVTLATDSTGVISVDDNDGTLTVDAPTSAPLSTVGYAATITTSFVIGDSAAYAINDAISDSTSAPTAGGFTFTSAARASGGSGIITDLIVTSSADAATLLQAELFIFDSSVTAINTNAAFVISDAEALTAVAKIPFTLEDIGNNGFFHAQNLNIGFTTVGSANLRFLVRAKNAYTSAADTLNFRLKVMQIN